LPYPKVKRSRWCHQRAAAAKMRERMRAGLTLDGSATYGAGDSPVGIVSHRLRPMES
jgi:hypothetical protein